MFRKGVRGWAIVPILLSALLYAVLVWLLAGWVTRSVAGLEDALPSWLTWLGGVLIILYWLSVVGAITLTFSLLASLVASPFNGALAEAAERALTGQKPPSMSFGRLLLRLPHVLIQESKKILYGLLFSIPLLLLFLVPGVNVAAPILWFLWGAWLAALAFTDYVLDNHGHPFREMRRLLKSRVWSTMGFGSVTVLALTVPLLNVLTVPAAVCGGTVLFVTRLRASNAAREP